MSGGLARHLEAFFAEGLLTQQNVSQHTIASYRDAFRLLLQYAQEHLGKAPSELDLQDVDGPLVVGFLQHLENHRGNTARSRNARLAAIRSFFRFAAFREPERSGLVQRVLAIPAKRTERRPIDYLSRVEVDALLAAPTVETRKGRRDRTLLLVAVQTGLRVSELVSLTCDQVKVGPGAHVRVRGKGRKERCTPLRAEAEKALRAWMVETGGTGKEPLFSSSRGSPLSRDGVSYIVAEHVRSAAKQCPTLAAKRVTPHVLRHTTAMTFLESGVDHALIALWLGHESTDSTQPYIHASLQLKEKALAMTPGQQFKAARFRPDDKLMAFLRGL